MIKRAFVTGTSSGIGLGIAQQLLNEGWHVSGIDRTAAVIEHAQFTPVTVDLTREEDSIAAINSLLRQQVPDALVHCAGVLRVAPLGKLLVSDGELMWQLHVKAASLIANAVLPAMQAAQRGRVILLGSRVSKGIAGRSQYAASKAAIVALARSWAAEVIKDGVTVNVVSPAATNTRMLSDPLRASASPRLPPIGRLIEPSEIAALVSFLLSSQASAITGQDIAICGGASLSY